VIREQEMHTEILIAATLGKRWDEQIKLVPVEELGRCELHVTTPGQVSLADFSVNGVHYLGSLVREPRPYKIMYHVF
jgi:hypothetical protein